MVPPPTLPHSVNGGASSPSPSASSSAHPSPSTRHGSTTSGGNSRQKDLSHFTREALAERVTGGVKYLGQVCNEVGAGDGASDSLRSSAKTFAYNETYMASTEKSLNKMMQVEFFQFNTQIEMIASRVKDIPNIRKALDELNIELMQMVEGEGKKPEEINNPQEKENVQLTF
eukprot:Nk52_evm40s2391 gene=Nk52_evmTU40s2391